MTYADNYNIRTTSVKFNDVADALDGLITRNYAGLTTGTSTAYIATPTPAWDAYTTAGLVVIIPHVSNSGASTLNISGLGARDLKIGNSAIASGVLQQNIPTLLAYTGTYFEVLLQSISIPVGTIYSYAGSTAPAGYLLCDGAALNTYTYRTLHAITSNIYGGTAYNPGTTDQPGALTTFNLPDLSRRIPVGKGASDTLGASDGVAYASRSLSHNHSISHTHTIPAHQHTVPAHYHYAINTAGITTLNVDIAHSHNSSSVTGTVGGTDGTHTHTMQITGSHEHSLRVEGGQGSSTNLSLISAQSTGTSTAQINPAGDHSHAIYTTNSGHGHGHNLSAAGQTLGATTKYINGYVGPGAGASGDVNFSTLVGEGGVTTDSQSTANSGSSTQPYLVLNYIIKT